VRPVLEEIAWSRQKDTYQALLQTAVAAAPANQQVSTTPAAPGQAAGSPAASTEFEEVSIRPCDPNILPPGRGGGGPNMFRMTPGRTYGTCLTLATLIRTAYGYGLLEGPPGTFKEGPRGPGGRGDMSRYDTVLGFGIGIFLGSEDGGRVRGGPDWVRSELYTIEAVAPESADAQTMRGPMLRALLERRFGLKVHIETEQIRAFELTVAPGGLEMKEGTCSHTPGVGRGSAMGWRTNIDAARRGETTTDPCGLGFLVNGPNMLFIGAGTGVPLFVEVVDAPVFNRTGIPDSARFNFVLEYLPDDRLGHLGQIPPGGGAMALQIASDPASVPRAPDFFTALEHQLGLKLAPARAPNEFIVIDHVERPSPN
jgi:uncharacterized protein (TIGR03435 family)